MHWVELSEVVEGGSGHDLRGGERRKQYVISTSSGDD